MKSATLFIYTGHQVKPKKNSKHFLKIFEANLEHISNQRPDLVVVICDFNIRCSNCWKNDIKTARVVKLTVPQRVMAVSYHKRTNIFYQTVLFPLI